MSLLVPSSPSHQCSLLPIIAPHPRFVPSHCNMSPSGRQMVSPAGTGKTKRSQGGQERIGPSETCSPFPHAPHPRPPKSARPMEPPWAHRASRLSHHWLLVAPPNIELTNLRLQDVVHSDANVTLNITVTKNRHRQRGHLPNTHLHLWLPPGRPNSHDHSPLPCVRGAQTTYTCVGTQKRHSTTTLFLARQGSPATRAQHRRSSPPPGPPTDASTTSQA